MITGTARWAVKQARALAEIVKGGKAGYDFFRSAVFKFTDVSLAIIGRARGEGRWLDDEVKVFYGSGKPVGAVVLGNIRKALRLEKGIREGLFPTAEGGLQTFGLENRYILPLPSTSAEFRG